MLHGADRLQQHLRCPRQRSFLPPGRANEDHRVDEQGRTIPVDELRLVVETAARWACADAGIGLDGATILTPDYKSGLWPTTRGHQLFAELRVETPIKTDVVLVPRRRKLAPERNQPDSWWEDLAGQLREVGLIVEMYPTRLNEAIARLSAARLAAGASTGGLHLASLCRCPHYVWGSGPEARWTPWAITNRQRYETVWNPLGTPCRYDECGWQPPMAHAIDGIRRALDEIGLVRGRSLPAWTLRPQWRIRRRLARLLEAPAGGGVVPWRVRQLVREWM